MADDKQLNALLELERRAMTGDPAITPEIKAKISTKLKAYRDQQLAKPLATESEGTPLPAWAATPFDAQISIYGGINRGLNTFKDEYAGNTVTGGLENSIQGLASGFGSEGQRDWWAQFGSTDNVIRNDLFGAALTDGEKAAYAATTVTPRMDPVEVRRNLQSRRDILNGALKRRVNFLKAQGYSPRAIEAASGEFAEQLGAAVVAPPAPPPPGTPAGDIAAAATVGARGAVAPAIAAGNAATSAPLDPEGAGDIGFASKASNEANSLPVGAQEFQRDLQDKINRGELKNAREVIAYAAGSNFNEGRGFVIDADQAEAAIKSVKAGRGVGVATPQYQMPAVDAGRKSAVIDPFVRGAADVASLGMADEIAAAGNTIFNGGTMRENLARERAVDAFDTENNFGSRFTGQIAGGFLLPSRVPGAALEAKNAAIAAGETIPNAALSGARAATRRGVLEGSLYGAGYGFGSGTDPANRVGNAVASGVGGALAALGVGKVGESWIKAGALVPPSLPPAGNKVYDAAKRIDVELMPADVGGVGTRMASGAIGMTPGAIPMAEAAERSIGSAAAARNRIAGNMATDREGAGQAAQRGAEAFLSASERRASTLYDNIPIAGGNPASLGNTRATLTELTAGMESNPELSRLVAENPRLKAFLDALTPKAVQVEIPPKQMPGGTPIPQTPVTEFRGGNLSWQDMKRFRSIIGEIIGQPGLAEDTSTVSMRKLYGALSQDMEATARAAGPKAYDSWKKADRYWRGRQERVETVLVDILGKDYRKGAGNAFDQIQRWSQEQGGNSAKLSQALRSLPKEEADTVRATIISKLGQAAKGQQEGGTEVFSPATFVTHWSGLSERAKRVLFNDAEMRKSLDDLATVTVGMKNAQKFANVSRTGNAVNGLALLASLWASPVATAGLAGSQLAAGKLLSSQWMVRQLVRSAKQANDGVPRETVIRDLLAKLPAGARRNPQIANEIGQLEQQLIRAANDNASTTGRVAAQEEANQKDQ